MADHRLAALDLGHRRGGSGDEAILGPVPQGLYSPAEFRVEAISNGHEPLKILMARLRDMVEAGLLGESGSRTVAVPTQVLTRERSVVFV